MEEESWSHVKDRRKIQEIFERMVSKNMEIKVLIDEERRKVHVPGHQAQP